MGYSLSSDEPKATDPPETLLTGRESDGAIRTPSPNPAGAGLTRASSPYHFAHSPLLRVENVVPVVERWLHSQTR